MPCLATRYRDHEFLLRFNKASTNVPPISD